MNINPLQHFIIPQHEFPALDDHVKRIQAAAIDMTDNLIVQAITQAAKEDGVTDLYLIDKKFAADAIREKLEREDPKPLTLEELRQMDGEPVWIDDWWEDSHGWELSMDASDYFEGERRTEKEYGSIWVAYRHKPKEAHHD